MRCEHCGTELDIDQTECRRCQLGQSSVQVLSPEEKRHFDGITIETDGNTSRYQQDGWQENAGPRVFVKQMHIHSTGLGFIPKLLIGMVLLGLFLFVALPIVLIFVTVGLLTWFLSRR